MRGRADVWPQPPPQEAMTALVGLLRAINPNSNPNTKPSPTPTPTPNPNPTPTPGQVGLLRAKDRDAMQLSILQLHRSLANSAQDTLADPSQIDGAPPLPSLNLGGADGLLSPVGL